MDDWLKVKSSAELGLLITIFFVFSNVDVLKDEKHRTHVSATSTEAT
jgi:hypothetical protein